MNAATTIQSGTIQMKRSHLVGLVVGVMALSVAPSYPEGVAAMTPEELAANWGRTPVGNPRQDYIDAVSEMTPTERAATWGNTLMAR